MDGIGIAAIGVGTVFLYGAIKGYSPVIAFQNIITGKNPNENQTTAALTMVSDSQSGPSGTSGSGNAVANTGSAKAILQKTATQFGWGSGQQWICLDKIEMSEAGYNVHATNPSSKAYGLAQSLGHPFAGGPASNGINEYGGYGLSAAQSRAASMGSAPEQALWMCNYIKDKFGTPCAAWAFHQANNSY